MTHIITAITDFDSKRNKVTLDYGEVTFLLYKGECRKLGFSEELSGKILSDEQFDSIMNDILLPRAKKRVLYYLKNADKTRDQIKRRLKEGFYPDQIIEETLCFLDKYGFADDGRYAEQYIDELRGRKSAKEIAQKLSQRGISRQDIAEKLAALSTEDEYAAASGSLRKKYPGGVTLSEMQKAYGYLARRGFAYNAIEHAVRELMHAETPDIY